MLSGEALFCSGECRRWRCRIFPPDPAAATAAQALPSGTGGETGDEQGEGVEPGRGGAGRRGGLLRAPPPPVGLPRAEPEEEDKEGVPVAEPPAPRSVCVPTVGLLLLLRLVLPPRAPALLPLPSVGRVGLAARAEGKGGGGGGWSGAFAATAAAPAPRGMLPPPLLVGLPCCLSWKGTVARMGCRRLLVPAAPPAVATTAAAVVAATAAAPPPPEEVAEVGEPLRLTRGWEDMLVFSGRPPEAGSVVIARRGSKQNPHLPLRPSPTPALNPHTRGDTREASPAASSTIVASPASPIGGASTPFLPLQRPDWLRGVV